MPWHSSGPLCSRRPSLGRRTRHPESGPTGRQGTVQQLQMPCNRAAVRSPATGDPYYSDGVHLSEVGIQALVEAMSGSLLQARSGSRASGRPVAYARRTWSHRWWHRTARSVPLQQRPVHVARPLSRSLWQDGGWRPDKQGLIAQAALPSVPVCPAWGKGFLDGGFQWHLLNRPASQPAPALHNNSLLTWEVGSLALAATGYRQAGDSASLRRLRTGAMQRQTTLLAKATTSQDAMRSRRTWKKPSCRRGRLGNRP